MTNFYLIWFIATKLIFWSPFMVDGQSMEPSFHHHELFMIDRQVFRQGDLNRGDVIVFSLGQIVGGSDFFYIKRVIGLPGEMVKISGSDVYVKRPGDVEYIKLSEPYTNGPVNYGDERYFLVPEGEYFVLGDNRDHSKDSRAFIYPYVKAGQIYGKFLWELK